MPTTRRERFRGLRGRRELQSGHALLLLRAGSIHTFGVGFPITTALLDADLRVLHVKLMAPRRLLLPRRAVRNVLECAIGDGPEVGDVLTLGG